MGVDVVIAGKHDGGPAAGDAAAAFELAFPIAVHRPAADEGARIADEVDVFAVVVVAADETVGPASDLFGGVDERGFAGVNAGEDDVVDLVDVFRGNTAHDFAFALLLTNVADPAHADVGFGEVFDLAEVHRFGIAAEHQRKEVRAGKIGGENVNDGAFHCRVR